MNDRNSIVGLADRVDSASSDIYQVFRYAGDYSCGQAATEETKTAKEN